VLRWAFLDSTRQSAVPEAKGRSTVAETTAKQAVPAAILAWLFPGAGHFYLRRPGKAVIFMVAIGALFALGVVMDSRLDLNLGLDDVLASLFSLAQMAIGLPYFVARMLGFQGDVKSVTFEYGNTFTAVAGLLNILVVLDAYDTALGRKQ
jgi:TM2 domain-containing membrane protein YozV